LEPLKTCKNTSHIRHAFRIEKKKDKINKIQNVKIILLCLVTATNWNEQNEQNEAKVGIILINLQCSETNSKEQITKQTHMPHGSQKNQKFTNTTLQKNLQLNKKRSKNL
jgi:Icc-related predicted phosphoesterase